MKRRLTADEKESLKKLLDSDQAIPVEFLPLLFPCGDGTTGERENKFRDNTKRLPSNAWTAFPQRASSAPIPAREVQAAWAWRREIWHVHFGCAELLHRAYRSYTVGWYADANGWNDMSRNLLRYGLLVGALTLHNGFEDRIAQLANALLASPLDEAKVSFRTIFVDQGLPRTWEAARRVGRDASFKKVHDLANEVKHRWTGEFVLHFEKPREKLARLRAASIPTYEQPGLPLPGDSFLPPNWKPSIAPETGDMPGRIAEQVQKSLANLDAICELLQKSHNLLVDLALCLDTEINWPARGLQPMQSPATTSGCNPAAYRVKSLSPNGEAG